MNYIKKYLHWIAAALSFIIFLILLGVSNHMAASLLSQNMADRWSSEGGAAQISCFFSVNSNITRDAIEEFEHSVDDMLEEDSITAESSGADGEEANESARLWADAYSADGSVTIASDGASFSASAIGIGGDFFLFHPLQLVSGAYFSGNDLMQDYCVLDEEAAWQLFGSNDIAGQMVTIGGVPHMVTGVIRRPDGRLNEAAGLSETVVYVSYDTLEKYGVNNGINHYEIVMPEPVSGYALGKVGEMLADDEKNTEIIQNDTRFSLLSRIQTLSEFGTRSMNGKAIIYPYWENEARGYEDIIALITVFMLIFLLYPAVFLIIMLIKWWRHRTWSFRQVWNKLYDKGERLAEAHREKRSGRNLNNNGKGENIYEKEYF
ncbi:MAG: ABC transporter permease [Lachnospiraceae bacterium]|nr:ABC transporter permease [Lachnospiraceae bacterium]